MSQDEANFEYDHYSISMSNSRPTSALSMISGITGGHKQMIDDRKDDFEESVVVPMGQFESLIGLK